MAPVPTSLTRWRLSPKLSTPPNILVDTFLPSLHRLPRRDEGELLASRLQLTQISNNPPQHLANYEVLQHFLALKKDNDVLVAAAQAKKNRDIKGAFDQIPLVTRRGEIGGPEIPEVPELTPSQLKREDDAARRGVSKDLVWVQDEVLKYLCADYNVTARQTAEGVRGVADRLQDYGLTKAELLQACNLAPTNQVGMYLVS